MSALLSAEGFVLAGGQSSRMGRDKALLELAGKPLIFRALNTLRSAGLLAKIAGAKADLSPFSSVVPDEITDAGPLGGICSALEVAEADLIAFLPVDLPLIPASLIRILIEDAGLTGVAVTVPSLNGFAQTFPAVVRREASRVLRAELEAGRLGVFAAFRSLGVRVVPVEFVPLSDEHGWPAYRWFWNVNTPEDLARVESALSAG
ncbi:molybdenum cofactor guanylyltransferase [Occallatibacter riparius]|uniref:Probable molybdenum cofactor guanylyltransferase n=1 Tax=Occallatibacter riparius TaxID=1002689 RepID=A0A9J7BP15_9BACT|nr:molybdenum cofactor guanylyltransferase [Occallatibacter riparius]UWZ82662.1 molybdenum cofactor guanylyltransferase [Occallatibacter riparius]